MGLSSPGLAWTGLAPVLGSHWTAGRRGREGCTVVEVLGEEEVLEEEGGGVEQAALS